MEQQTLSKTCTKCGEHKPLSEYYEIKRTKPKVRNYPSDGHKAMCKACYVARAGEWAKKNKDKRKEIAAKWAQENKDKVKETQAKHRKTESFKESAKKWRDANGVEYARKRRAIDPMYAFKVKMRSILIKAFARGGYTKRSASNIILGCDWQTLMDHLESKFQPGMTWANRGEWHIDHIIPLATAETEDDLLRLNHYTNLQPLWAADNLKKNARLDYQYERTHSQTRYLP